MKKTAYIAYKNFYNYQEKRIITGGVETYILNLAKVLKSLNYQVQVFQVSDKNFSEELNGYFVNGVKCSNKSYYMQKKIVFRSIKKRFNEKNDLMIFGADHFSTKTHFKKTITIQHGVSWDIDQQSVILDESFLNKIIFNLKKVKSIYNAYQNYKKVSNIVFVDYNFFNWLMTVPFSKKVNYKVIPNFSHISSTGIFQDKDRGKIKILFARRFEKHRGTRLFANSIIPLLKKYKNIEVTFAGEGPDKHYLKELFSNNKNIVFDEYKNEDSIKYHRKFDIAVIPSTGSEGTSFSILEAMSSGCLVVATHVGGITNLIFDEHNGFLCKPHSKDLELTIEKAIKIINEGKEKKLIENAHKIVRDSFSFEKWKKEWSKFIISVENIEN